MTETRYRHVLRTKSKSHCKVCTSKHFMIEHLEARGHTSARRSKVQHKACIDYRLWPLYELKENQQKARLGSTTCVTASLHLLDHKQQRFRVAMVDEQFLSAAVKHSAPWQEW